MGQEAGALLARTRTISRAEAQARESDIASPVVKWAGGKRSLLDRLLALAPPHFGAYFEPFLGGASFFLAISSIVPIDRAILSDANCDLIHVYDAIRNDYQAVMSALDTLQPEALNEAFYYNIRDNAPLGMSPAELAARFIYLNKTCYNGLYRVNRKGQFNVPFGRYHTPPNLYNRDNLTRVASLLSRAELYCGDFTTILSEAKSGDFVYLDPPYVPLNVTASFTRYTKSDFNDSDQRRLAETIHDLTDRGCHILLSNSETALVRKLYDDPRYFIEVVYAPRNINSNGTGRSRIPELAIRNYAATRGARTDARTTDRDRQRC